ncbi:MAG: TIGR01777 family oxidoreductase [Thermoanaerobaculia bacterium]
MRIVIAGGSGFVGEVLAAHLAPRGDVAILTRNAARVRLGRPVVWNPAADGPWRDVVASADVVINLAGESIGEGRWTEARKESLRSSRIEPTRALAAVLRAHPRPDRLFISASGTGYYGARGDEVLDENAVAGDGFLARLAEAWEAAAREAEGAARLVIPRIGVVLAPDGGALPRMLLPFRLFVGGPMGSGRQWMSWIHRDDLVALVAWSIDTPAASGIYNATAPQPVTNREFAHEIGKALRRPAWITTPAFALRFALGEMADALLLSGQRVVPERLIREGFRFSRGSVAEALRDLD